MAEWATLARFMLKVKLLCRSAELPHCYNGIVLDTFLQALATSGALRRLDESLATALLLPNICWRRASDLMLHLVPQGPDRVVQLRQPRLPAASLKLSPPLPSFDSKLHFGLMRKLRSCLGIPGGFLCCLASCCNAPAAQRSVSSTSPKTSPRGLAGLLEQRRIFLEVSSAAFGVPGHGICSTHRTHLA